MTRKVPKPRATGWTPRAALLALGLALAAPAPAQEADSPERVLQLWQAALAARDYTTYVGCLHIGARQIPEYGSREAMEFWAEELDDLARRGFRGRFEVEPVRDAGGRFPAGAVRAAPIVDGRRLGEVIVLVLEAGQWTILRIFS